MLLVGTGELSEEDEEEDTLRALGGEVWFLASKSGLGRFEDLLRLARRAGDTALCCCCFAPSGWNRLLKVRSSTGWIGADEAIAA